MLRLHVPAGATPFSRTAPVGASLVELLLVLAATLVLVSVAAGAAYSVRDAARAQQAVRRLAGTLQDARSRAVMRGHQVAVRFSVGPGGHGWAVFEDGNGNGVLTADVDRGADRPVGPPRALGVIAPGVGFGTAPGTPDVDGAPLIDDSGLRLGPGQWLSFSPDGSSSSGTVYLRGPGHHQHAVRALGPTGRVRVFRFDGARRRWLTP